MNHDLSQPHPDPRPWYRQFWPWFIIALPASAVIAGTLTLVIAVQNADDLVAENWYRDGRAINRDLEAERLARQLGVTAQLRQHDGMLEVSLRASSALPWPEQLALALRHPTMAAQDVTLTLTRDSDGIYRAPLTLMSGERYISLETDHWRLSGKAALDTPVQLGNSS